MISFRVIDTLQAAFKQCPYLTHYFLNVNSFYKQLTKDKNFVHSLTTFIHVLKHLFAYHTFQKMALIVFLLQQKILFFNNQITK